MSQQSLLTNVELIGGDITETLGKVLNGRPELKFSLLHIDVDIYEPTRAILDQCFDRTCRGGVIVFDDYGKVLGVSSLKIECKIVCAFAQQKQGGAVNY